MASINEKLAEVISLTNAGELNDLAEEAPYLLQCLDETLDKILERMQDKEKTPQKGR